MMAKKKVMYGILAMMLVFTLSVIGCGDGASPGTGNGNGNGNGNGCDYVNCDCVDCPGDPCPCKDNNGNGGNGGGSTIQGSNLRLHGQVYRPVFDSDDPMTAEWVWVEYRGNRYNVAHPWKGGSGTITYGILDFSIGTPPGAEMGSLADWAGIRDGWRGMNVSPANARIGLLHYLAHDRGEMTRELRYRLPGSVGQHIAQEKVYFIYAETEVRLTRARLQGAYSGFGGQTDFTRELVDITLRQGWNAIHERLVVYWHSSPVLKLCQLIPRAGMPYMNALWFIGL